MAKKKTDRVPVPVVTIDNDASIPPLTRETGAALVRLCEDGRDEEVTELMMDARNQLACQVDEALGPNEGEMASVLTDIAVRHVVSKLTAEAVLALVQSLPDLVLETERAARALVAERSAA